MSSVGAPSGGWSIDTLPLFMRLSFFKCFITGRNEVVTKVIFLQASVCPQGGWCAWFGGVWSGRGVCLVRGVSASVHAGIYPPGPGRPPGPARPPQTRQTPPSGSRHPPPDQADPPRTRYPPGSRPPWTRHPPPEQTPPPPPPRKQTSVYGQRAAGTHPTGMHSCYTSFHKGPGLMYTLVDCRGGGAPGHAPPFTAQSVFNFIGFSVNLVKYMIDAAWSIDVSQGKSVLDPTPTQ